MEWDAMREKIGRKNKPNSYPTSSRGARGGGEEEEECGSRSGFCNKASGVGLSVVYRLRTHDSYTGSGVYSDT